MQNYSPKEFKTQNSQKDKPLQRSIMVHNTFTPQNSTPNKVLTSTEQSPYHILKKSTSTVLDNSSQHNLSYSYINNSANLNISTTSSNISNKLPYQFKTINHHQNSQYKSMTNLNSLRSSQVISQNQKFNHNRQRKLQQILHTPTKSQNLDIQIIINKITKELRQRHLPQILRSLKKEIYDDLHSLRFQFNTIKEEQKKINERLDENTTILKKDPESSLAQTYLFLLEEKINKVETKLSEKFQKLNVRFQKQMQSYSQKHFNIGNLKSSIPNIKLQYKESFVVKDCDNKNKINQEIIVCLVSYNVDKLGYLLDSDNRYILDSRGFQIRLQQKHLKLLEQHKILYK